MRKNKLDAIDRKILSNLQTDGRMSNVDLAGNVGISAPPCLRRVRGLEESGVIASYHAKIDPVSMGYNVTVFALVKLKSQAEEDLQAFEQRCCDLDMIRECHMLAGDVDFMLKIVARNWDDYQAFLTGELTSAPNVSSVKSSLSIRSAKDEPGVPVSE